MTTPTGIDWQLPDTQPQYRRDYNATDQWGRLWLVTIEHKTGGVVGIPTPAGWSDPLHIPSRYLELDRQNPNRIIVHYQRWHDDLQQAWKDWEQRYREEGMARYGEKFDAEERPTPFMLSLVGPPPMDPMLPLKAMQGDPQYLGITPKPRPEDEVASLQRRVRELEEQNQKKEGLLQRMFRQGDADTPEDDR